MSPAIKDDIFISVSRLVYPERSAYACFRVFVCVFRAETCDIRIQLQWVSRKHAELIALSDGQVRTRAHIDISSHRSIRPGRLVWLGLGTRVALRHTGLGGADTVGVYVYVALVR